MEETEEFEVVGLYSVTGIPPEGNAPGLDSEVSKKDTPTVAATGPGLFSEIDRKAKDLLYKDFSTGQKFSLTTCSKNGLAITTASTRKHKAIFSKIQTQLKNNNVTVDVEATLDSRIFPRNKMFTTITTERLPIPGLKKIISFPIPYQQTAGKVELQYLDDYAGISLGVGLNSKPLVNLSCVFGNKTVAVGADVAFDSSTEDFTEYNAGLKFTTPDLAAALMLINKGESLAASYYQLVNEESGSAVGGELTHSFSRKKNSFAIGALHALDPLTTVKIRYSSRGMIGALIKHEWRPKTSFTLSTQVDTNAINKAPEVGLAVALKP
ncbi:mitochondrial outer membrane protein porin 4-like [Oryza brachyantha]|uniref:mitochondrial outer membrane protein porin 4-like n=1 Tax=Oryza brachyantha TaxID=4533 RepID=UPI0003EAC4C2|nr:mitochondrial outer membrane protein porin 4-like [Oryza brachyantha]